MKEHCIIDVATVLIAITFSSFLLIYTLPRPREQTIRRLYKSSNVGQNPSDTFLIDSDDIDVNWRNHHQIPSNGRSGSSRSDFAAVIFNSTDQQFPFFIVESETVVAEAAFEYNHILAAAYYLS